VKSPVGSDVLWERGKGFSAGIDDPEYGRMMDGEYGDQGFQPGQKLMINPGRFEIAGCMDPSMADAVEFDAELFELVEDQDGYLPMVIERGLDAFSACTTIVLNGRRLASLHTDPVRFSGQDDPDVLHLVHGKHLEGEG
jgi:hypothetical protein